MNDYNMNDYKRVEIMVDSLIDKGENDDYGYLYDIMYASYIFIDRNANKEYVLNCDTLRGLIGAKKLIDFHKILMKLYFII